MMRNKSSYLGTFLIAWAVLAFSSLVQAQMIPPSAGGPDPSLDGVDAGAQTGSAVATGAKNVATKVTDFMNDLNNKIQGATDAVNKATGAVTEKIGNVSNAVTSAMSWNPLNSIIQKKKGDANIQLARKLTCNIQSEDEIIESFDKMFLRLPVDILHKDKYKNDQGSVSAAYRKKAKEFYYDSMVEMYITVHSLDDRIAELSKQIDSLSSCYVAGSGSSTTDSTSLCLAAGDTDQSISIWKNYYQVNVVYDSVLQLLEELTAIRAQYEVAKAFASGIQPLTETEQQVVDGTYKDRKKDSETSEEQHSDASDVSSWNYSFSVSSAQVFSASADEADEVSSAESLEQTSALTQVSDSASSSSGISNKYARVMSEPLKIYSALGGDVSKYRDLGETSNILAQLSLAIEIHNLKFHMPSYREGFVKVAKMRRLHDKAIEKLKESEDCVVDYLSKYYTDPNSVWLGEGCVYSGTNVVCQTSRSLQAQDLSQIRVGDVLCPNNSSMLCNSFGINSYENRGGFSGWLVSAYKTAKAEKAVEISEDDISPSMAVEDLSTDVSDFEAGTESVAANTALTGDSAWATPSQEETFTAQTREADLIGWQIGAEGAKALGEDMVATEPKWGKVHTPYPLWNDEKYFYDQYLAEKYTNMKRFVQNADLRSAVLTAVQTLTGSMDATALIGTITAADLSSFSGTVLATLEPLIEQSTAEEAAASAEAYRQAQADESSLSTAFNQSMEQQVAAKAAVYATLDAQTSKLKAQKEEYNTQVSAKSEAVASSAQQLQFLALEEDRREQSGGTYKSGLSTSAKSDKEIYDANADEAAQKQEAAGVAVEDTRESIDDTQDSLAAVKQKMVAEKGDFVQKMNAAMAKTRLAREALSQGNPQVSGSDILSDVLESETNVAKKAAFSTVLALAEEYADAVKSAIVEQIDEAYDEMTELGEDLYLPENHDELVNIHQKLMVNIRNLDPIDPIETVLPVGDVAAALSRLYAAAVYQAACENDVCQGIAEEYFVGVPPKAKDFEAPKAIVTTYTAPLREVVHFDLIDYQNVTKTEDGQNTTREAMSDYGQDIPLIWKQILGSDGFVEKEVDLAAVLNHAEGADDHLLRGGTYPCVIGQYTVDFKNGALYLYPSVTKGEVCKNITSVSTLADASSSFVFKNGERVSGVLGKDPDDRQPSELALLLKNGNAPAFSGKLLDIVSYFDELAEKEDATEKDVQQQIYEDALLNRNQFGDYLTFVETEMDYQKGLEDLEVRVDEVRQDLITRFKEFGYDLPEDFDLSDQATYDNIVEKLDERKNKLVAYARSLLGKISTLDEDLIEEKVDQIQNQLKLLEIDSDETVQIATTDTADSSFEERVKRAKVDQTVVGTYKTEADDALENALKNFKEPYCAVY